MTTPPTIPHLTGSHSRTSLMISVTHHIQRKDTWDQFAQTAPLRSRSIPQTQQGVRQQLQWRRWQVKSNFSTLIFDPLSFFIISLLIPGSLDCQTSTVYLFSLLYFILYSLISPAQNKENFLLNQFFKSFYLITCCLVLSLPPVVRRSCKINTGEFDFIVVPL